MTRRQVGSGAAWYVATRLDAGGTDRLVERLVSETGVEQLPGASPLVEVTRRVGDDASWLFVINHGEDEASVPTHGTDLVGDREVGGRPAGPGGRRRRRPGAPRRGTGRLMLAAQRRGRILSELSRDGTVRVTDLVELLGVSDMTVRRDLVALHREGLLEKVHGGALAVAEPSSSEPGFAAKSVQRRREKEAIAAAAAELVHPGMAIAVSAGTTTHALTGHLARIPDLTVVTNSVWVADVLHRTGEPTTSVLLTGGLRTPSDALVGPVAVSSLRSLHVDAFFMGVHGMDVRAGFSTPNLLESETNRAMIERSRRLIVCVDSSKWGVVGLSSMAGLSAAAVLVTDSGLPAQASGALSDHVGELVVVDPIDDEDDDLDEVEDA